MTRRSIGFAAAAVVLLGAWYWFRPERAILDRRVEETALETDAQTVLRGAFHSNAHPTRGTATVQQLHDGSLTLRFTDFETSDGPDVQIYLVASDDVQDAADVARGFVNLGALKGNIGDQNYRIPAGTDLSRYRAVSVWCRRFGVNFGAAALEAVPQGS